MTRFLIPCVSLSLMVACSPQPDQRPQTANPAATFCIENGGRYDIREGNDGQVGICVLADGTEVDAWQYFRDSNPD
ncbi:DUF333 domain-containing protein [Primorskyibacter sp. S87]|uniref:putative hemolysin n=1 Tax=Primorskyibacter sp. S87 TaxID=3415126 RepID=UPI003C7A9108